ncbi:MAG: hypothetical protein NT025_00340 [bacterium]|nr:hypothetical protein [bacterium]
MRTETPIILSMFLWAAVMFTPQHVDPLPGDDRGECTTAVIRGSATANGRPLLWKNRDVSYPDQEIVHFRATPYSFVSIITAGDTTQAWGGVNETGFAIEDATNLNTSDQVAGPDDDGIIIKLALTRCRTVADFQTILDSTQVPGHTQPAIFGVIDSAGGAAIFETFAHSYVRYNASDSAAAPLGVLVRSNYSYAGSATGRVGVYRHDRAKLLIENAVQGDTLTAKYLCRTVARDLRTTNSFDPYPLPYEGQQGGLPRGWISTAGAICRRLSVSGLVIEGVLTTESARLSTMWAFPMAVQYGVPVPFWEISGVTPVQVNGDSVAPLCSEGLRIRTMAQHFAGFRDTLDTYILVDGRGGGVHLTTFPLEDRIFARGDSALAVWRAAGQPDSAAMTTMTFALAHMAYDTMRLWPGPGDLYVPPRAVQNLTLYWVPGLGLRLRWSPVTQDTLGAQITPAGYTIWRYRRWSSARDSLGFTSGRMFVVPEYPGDSTAIYEVRAIRE